MSSSGYKIRGYQRSRTDKPYDRPTGVVGKVKEWFSPSSWTGYFNTSTDTPSAEKPFPSGTTEQLSVTQMRSHLPLSEQGLFSNRPQKSEALVSENTMVYTEHEAVSSPSNNTKIGTGSNRKKLLITPKYTRNAPSSLDKYRNNSGPEEEEKPTLDAAVDDIDSDPLVSQKVESNSSNDSDVSWIAEAEKEEDMEQVNNVSDVSWIAEDDEENKEKVEGSTDLASHRVTRPMSISLVTDRLYNTSEDVPTTPFVYDIGEGKAGVAQSSAYLVTPGAEVDVERVANPVFVIPNPSELHGSVRAQPLMSSTVTKLNSRRIIDSTTPRLGPVRDYRGEAASSPSQIRSHLFPNDDSFSQPPTARMTTPSAERSQRLGRPSFSVLPFLASPSSSVDTNESIKQSPFHSPFYSGKTAFGGAASGQRLRFKRPRPESNPPPYIQHQVTVRPTNERGNAQPVVSQTAKRILSSLQTNHSPLSDARKMPMRNMPATDDDQPTKRRRISKMSSPRSTNTPPPVTPLYSSSHATPSRLRPSSHEESPLHPQHQVTSTHQKTTPSSGMKSSGLSNTGLSSSSNSSPAASRFSTSSFSGGVISSGPPSMISGSAIDFSSSAPKHSAILSGLKFMPAPPTEEVGTEKTSDKKEGSPAGRDREKSPTRETSGIKMASKSSGKMRVGRRNAPLHESRKSRLHDEDEVDTFINPLAPPPSVGLSFGKGISEIKFHAQALPKFSAMPAPPNTTIAAFQSSTMESISSSSNYSFSCPISITNRNTATDGDHQVSSFGFTIPKSHMHVTASPRTSPMVSITALKSKETEPPTLSALPIHSLGAHPVVPPIMNNPLSKEPSLPKQVLPLISGSVEEMFKKVSAPQKLSIEPSKLSRGNNTLSQLIPLPPPSDTTLKTLFAPPSNSWECDTCMLTNKSDADKCVACSTPKPRAKKDTILFPPPSNSWECDTCMLINKNEADKCVACSTPKPGAKKDTILFPPPSNSWECDTCMLINKNDADKCVACSTTKPGAKKNAIPKSLGSMGGFKVSTTLSAPGPSIQPLPQFSRPTGSWSCDTCLVDNKAESTSCVACSTPKPGETLTGSGGGGLSLITSGGFKLGSNSALAGFEIKPIDSKILKIDDSGGFKISSGFKIGGDSGGLKIGGASGGLKIGATGGLKIDGASGGLKISGASGGLKIDGASGGLKIGATGGFKIGGDSGVLKFGSEFGGIKVGATGGLNIGETGGFKIGDDLGGRSEPGGLKIGGESGGLKVGGESGGLKIGGDSGGLKIGGGLQIGSFKIGDNTGGLKIGGNTDASKINLNEGGVVSGANVGMSGGFKASGGADKNKNQKETATSVLMIGGQSVSEKDNPLAPANQNSSQFTSGLGGTVHFGGVQTAITAVGGLHQLGGSSSIVPGENNKKLSFGNNQTKDSATVVTTQLQLGGIPPQSLSTNVFAGAATFNFSAGKSNLGQSPLTSSVSTSFSGSGLKMGGITPQTNPVTAPFKFTASNPNLSSSQASAPSTFGGVSVSNNPLQNVKGFDFSSASPKAGLGLFGKATSSAPSVPFQFSGGTKSTLTSVSSSNPPNQGNMFSAASNNPVINFGASGPTLGGGLFGNPKGQSNTTQLAQPSLPFSSNPSFNRNQTPSGTSSMEMTMDNSIQQQQTSLSSQFQFGQPSTATATNTSNQGYNFNTGQGGMNFNFKPVNPPLFSGNPGNPPDISKRVIRKATRRKKT